MPKFRISHAAAMLHDIGVRFHASGVLRDNSGAALYDFFKTDFISDQEQSAILAICPQAIFRGAYAEYAPELRGIYICFPKAEMRRRLKSGLPHAA